MTTPTRTRKPTAPELVPGDAVLMADGGEAVLIGIEAGDALLRCGSLHDAPVRLPRDLVSKVAERDQTDRHERFRAEAVRRGELTP